MRGTGKIKVEKREVPSPLFPFFPPPLTPFDATNILDSFNNLNMVYKSDKFWNSVNWGYYRLLVVVAFKLSIVNSVDVRKICLNLFVTEAAP